MTKPKVVKRISDNKLRLMEQLKRTPIVEIACEKAGVSRATFYRWCQDDEAFAEQAKIAITEGKALVNDMAESQIISLIKDKSFPASSFWLKHNHPNYGNRLELSGSVSVAKEALTPDQEELVKQALLNAGLLKKEVEDEPDTNV